MATFRPINDNICKLNFDDKFFFELEVHEDTARKLARIADKQIQVLSALDADDPEAFDKAYNASLDALDEIFGEGAGADIMSIYEKPSLFDIKTVVDYITNEFKAAYTKKLNWQKATGTMPAAPRGRR